MSSTPYDAIVVGSGATGAWAAKELAESGLEVLVLEAGPEVSPADLDADRLAVRARRLVRRFVTRRQNVQAQHGVYHRVNPDLFVDDVDNPYTTADDKPFVWIRGRQVGGRTLTWGGVCLRLSDYEFRAAERDGFGVDWPLCHRDLAPYYARVERFLGVCGSGHDFPQLPAGALQPAMPMTPAEVAFKAVVEERWPHRHVIPGRGIPKWRGGSAWPADSSQATALAAALATGRVTVRAGAVARHVVVDGDSGLAQGVAFVDAEKKTAHEVLGRVVMLCASTLESTRILLNSACPRHPDGLGNASGALGHYLMDHLAISVNPRFPTPAEEPSQYAFGGPHSISIPRFKNVGEPEDRFLRGYGMWGAIQRTPPASPHAGDGVAGYLLAQGEMLPRFENRVTLDPERCDAWGIPTLHVECAWGQNEQDMARDMEQTLRELVAAAAGQMEGEFHQAVPGRWVHEVGTARMGKDPRTSVLDPFNRCWEAPNVLVTDGACWPSGGWQNPTLTMMAITARACEHLVGRLQRGET